MLEGSQSTCYQNRSLWWGNDDINSMKTEGQHLVNECWIDCWEHIPSMTGERPEYYFHPVLQSLPLQVQMRVVTKTLRSQYPLQNLCGSPDCQWPQLTLYYRNEFSWVVKAELLELKCHSLHRDLTNPQKWSWESLQPLQFKWHLNPPNFLISPWF